MTRDMIETIARTGADKLSFSNQYPLRYFTRACLAGVFIFVGTLLSCVAAAWFYEFSEPVSKLLGALTFSAALILIVLLGGELFTGSNFVMGISLYEQSVKPMGAVRIWILSWIGNFIGIFLICLLLAGSGAARALLTSYLSISVPSKLSMAWYELLIRGMLCNLLVCLGVYTGFRLKSECSKMVVIALVISTFVLAGLEHSIANMAFFTLYTLFIPGANLIGMGWNLLWVTLGNLLGGAVLLGLPVWYAAEPVR